MEQGNKAAGVIKIRAVFTGYDRHQTRMPDWGTLDVEEQREKAEKERQRHG